MLRAVDVLGFGGGFTLGVVQAGFELVAKKSLGVGFGVLNTLANQQLLGKGWEVQSDRPETWTVEEDVDLVFGNPPCSGFSTLSPAAFRGMDSSINECMWQLIRYAGRVSPKIVIFESVQQAHSQGRPLMRNLRAELERMTGQRYTLYHVLHNNAALGGASIRRRYFWTAVREDIKFGIESCATRYDFRKRETVLYKLDSVPTLNDIFLDLEPLTMTMEDQPYPSARRTLELPLTPKPGGWWKDHRPDSWINVASATRWARTHMHDGTGLVDGHDIARSPTYDRARELARSGVVTWEEGERNADVLRRYYETTGELPRSWRYMTLKPRTNEHGEKMLDEEGKIIMVPIRKDERLIETNFAMGHNQVVRWHGTRMARTITGGAVHLILHPHQDRTLTQREAARIQGFPDAWKIWPVRFAPDLGPGWGKGVPVHAGRWIGVWARRALEDSPGSNTGEEKGDREREINITNDYKPYTSAIGDPG